MPFPPGCNVQGVDSVGDGGEVLQGHTEDKENHRHPSLLVRQEADDQQGHSAAKRTCNSDSGNLVLNLQQRQR